MSDDFREEKMRSVEIRDEERCYVDNVSYVISTDGVVTRFVDQSDNRINTFLKVGSSVFVILLGKGEMKDFSCHYHVFKVIQHYCFLDENAHPVVITLF